MNKRLNPEEFLGADPEGLPALTDLQDERLQALWVLSIGKERLGITSLTPGEISIVLRDAYGIAVSWQKIEGILSRDRKAVAPRKKDGRRAYQLMQVGIEELASQTPSVIFVDPMQALSKLRQAQAVLAELRGDLRICDPYLDPRTLDLLADCNSASSIRLLTMNVRKRSALERDVRAFAREHGVTLDVRITAAQVLHDRYVIHKDGMFFFGTSLNSLGSKQSFVISLGRDVRETVLTAFDSIWHQASPLLVTPFTLTESKIDSTPQSS